MNTEGFMYHFRGTYIKICMIQNEAETAKKREMSILSTELQNLLMGQMEGHVSDRPGQMLLTEESTHEFQRQPVMRCMAI